MTTTPDAKRLAALAAIGTTPAANIANDDALIRRFNARGPSRSIALAVMRPLLELAAPRLNKERDGQHND